MAPKVSVILPTYNRSGSLPTAIMSVLHQSFGDLELIIVDDGSSEDIETIVRAIDDPRLKYVRRTANGGAGAARNTGLAHAVGEYVAFQDSDDIWLPNKLSAQMDMFATLPSSVGVVTGGKIIYGRDDHFNHGERKITYAPPAGRMLSLDEDQVGHILADNRLSLQNAVFRKNAIPGEVWFDTRAKANEDWEFAIRLAQHTLIYEDAAPVVLAFVSTDSISINRRKQILGVLRVLKNNKAILARYPQQRADLLLDVGRCLYKTNKRRLGTKFLLAGLRAHPWYTFATAAAMLRRSTFGALARRSARMLAHR